MRQKIKIIKFIWIRHRKLKMKTYSNKCLKPLLFQISIIAKIHNKTKAFIKVLSNNCLSSKKKSLSAKSPLKILKLYLLTKDKRLQNKFQVKKWSFHLKTTQSPHNRSKLNRHKLKLPLFLILNLLHVNFMTTKKNLRVKNSLLFKG